MNVAITIGSYRMPQFVELCVRRCLRLFGEDVPILISDDLSDKSRQIKRIAEQLNCGYVVGEGRHSHFGGDMQALLNALAWGEHSDIALKLSQRFIPVLPSFVESLERAFSSPNIMVALPGQIQPRQIARPGAGFYARFGILTDAIAFRHGSISAAEMLDIYARRFRHPKSRSDSFVETTIGWVLANKFPGQHVIVPEWTNHKPMEPKIYLRKSQSNSGEYARVAQMEGMQADWDLREWIQIEKSHYMPFPAG